MAASETGVRYRVGKTQEIFLKAVALLLDVAGFFLALTVVGEVATEIIGIAGDILFFIWFLLLGAGFTGRNSSAKLSTLIGNSLAESVPFLNAVYPGFSIEAWRLVKLMRKEDEEDASRRYEKDARAAAIRAQQERRDLERAAQAAAQAANDNQQPFEAAA